MKTINVDQLALGIFNAERTSNGDYPLTAIPADEVGAYKEVAYAAIPALRRHYNLQALKAQRDRLEAERLLDAEATELLRAATGIPTIGLHASSHTADFWRNAARKARELHRK